MAVLSFFATCFFLCVFWSYLQKLSTVTVFKLLVYHLICYTFLCRICAQIIHIIQIQPEYIFNLGTDQPNLVVVVIVATQKTKFKEWKLALQEIDRFLKADTAFAKTRTLRFNVLFDSHPSSVPYISRFHANRILRLQDALLTSYRRNEVCRFTCFFFFFLLKDNSQFWGSPVRSD